MNNEFFFNEELPKWPGLLVVGQPITKEQAMEVLIRTDGLDFMCNDRDWDRAFTLLNGVAESMSIKINSIEYTYGNAITLGQRVDCTPATGGADATFNLNIVKML